MPGRILNVIILFLQCTH